MARSRSSSCCSPRKEGHAPSKENLVRQHATLLMWLRILQDYESAPQQKSDVTKSSRRRLIKSLIELQLRPERGVVSLT
jgi:hypothetical protein